MKKVLLHIATPIASILTYVIAFVGAKLLFKIQEFLSSGVPIDYKVESDSIICLLVAPAFAMFAPAMLVKHIAPSGKIWHYLGVALFMIVGALLYCKWFELAGNVVGTIVGIVLLREKDDDA